MTEKTMCLLKEASYGNAISAFQAACALLDEGYGDVLAQAQFRRSAELSYLPAMRVLGILGLCNKLVTTGSSVYNAVYNTSPYEGIEWLLKAIRHGDSISAYIYGKCLQLGKGVHQDEEKAQIIISQTVPKLSFNEVFRFSMLIESIPENKKRQEDNVFVLSDAFIAFCMLTT